MIFAVTIGISYMIIQGYKDVLFGDRENHKTTCKMEIGHYCEKNVM